MIYVCLGLWSLPVERELCCISCRVLNKCVTHLYSHLLMNFFLTSRLCSLKQNILKGKLKRAPEIKRKSDKADTTRVLTLNEIECA